MECERGDSSWSEDQHGLSRPSHVENVGRRPDSLITAKNERLVANSGEGISCLRIRGCELDL